MFERQITVNDSQALAHFDLGEMWAHRDLLYFLTWRDIKVRYKQAAMGAAWAVIQPVVMMVTFAVFFGIFMGVSTDNMPFTLFFYCGLMPWNFFSSAVIAGSASLVGSSNLITKVYFPRMIVPTAAVGGLLVDLLITLIILVALALYYGIVWTWGILMFPLMLLLTLLLALDFAIWLAALTVKYRDIRHALPFTLQMWMFLTPIIYSLSVVPDKWRWAMYINPLTGIVEGIRASITGRSFNWVAICASMAIIVFTLPLSIQAFRRIEKSFADLI